MENEEIEYKLGDQKILAYRHEEENKWELYLFGNLCDWVEGDLKKLESYISERINEISNGEISKADEKIESAKKLKNIAFEIKEKGLEKTLKKYN